MTNCEFVKKDGYFIKAHIYGHSGSASFGNDIVCSSISASVQLVSNALTEIFKIHSVNVEIGKDSDIIISVPKNEIASGLLESLYLQFILTQKEYKEFIKVTITEV